MTRKGQRGGNNSFGYLKGKISRHANEYIREYQEDEDNKKRKEIETNKDRWYNVIEDLKIEDESFDNWYDNSPYIPDFISWLGEDFESVLSVLKTRLKFIRKESTNNEEKH